MQTLNEKDLSFIKENIQTNYDFLTTLGKIPAPSHQEDKRAKYCKTYMESLGATNVRGSRHWRRYRKLGKLNDGLKVHP